jgi:alkylation response protein AidB-like acyl-CoA dehydrogenase
MKREIYEADHLEFRDLVRDFVRKEVEPRLEEYSANKQLSRDFWRSAGELGLLGLCAPEQFGGAGIDDYRYNAVLGEELAKVTMAVSSSLVTHADIVIPYIVEFGSDEQKSRWLPGLCSGELISSIAMTEPEGGSDLAALRTTARREGDDFIVNGSKTFITNGFTADLVLLAARTTPGTRSKGITLFLIDTTLSGFVRGRKLDKVGLDESDTAELFFQDVRVSSSDVLGRLDQGFAHMMSNLGQERIGASVQNIANARQIVEETVEYARQRKAFGQSVGSFQAVKFQLAELTTRVDVAQAFIDRCIALHAAGELSDVDAAKAKWWSSEEQNVIIDHCVQVYGGYGYMNEYRVARAWRDARVTKIWAGTNEIMKEIIGRDLGL